MTETGIKKIALEQLDVQKEIASNTDPEKAPSSDRPMPATTTQQEDITTAGQRRINLIWEHTQQIIAISVCGVTLVLCGYLLVKGEVSERVPAFMLLSNVFFLVVGTYFQRTNHTKIGGIGVKPVDDYVGR